MERNVVVAGWGQVTQPKKISSKALNLMELMTQACHRAARIMSSKAALSSLDGIMVVTPGSRFIKNPDRILAQALNATPKLSMESGIGGNSPQTMINRAAGMIARNEIDTVLIAGAETYVQREEKTKKIESALFDELSKQYKGDDLIGSTPLENQYGIEHPIHGFPLFETALWAASGKPLSAHLKDVAQMWATFSEVASDNPFAWTRNVRSWQQIVTPGAGNRPIAFPYPKYMNSFVTVDQAASVILMAEEKAKPFSAKDRQTVYFIGGGYAQDSQRFLIEKDDFTSSPPLKTAVDKALTRANLQIDEIESLDLYSCFPCAVSIAKKMIGINDTDPRALTQTGGLGFFGGPGNNYNLHAVATLAENISIGQTKNGLVTALGWFLHKHAAGVYSAAPSQGSFQRYDLEDQNNPLSGNAPMPIIDTYTGEGFIDTYTIVYSKDQKPKYAVIYGRNKDNYRFIAQTRNHKDIFDRLTSDCCVGSKIKVIHDDKTKMNIAEML